MVPVTFNNFLHTGRLHALTLMWEARNIGRTTSEQWQRWANLSSYERNQYFKIWWDAKRHIQAIPYQLDIDFACDFCPELAAGTWNGLRLCRICATEVC